jgi:hypothetical protein
MARRPFPAVARTGAGKRGHDAELIEDFVSRLEYPRQAAAK